MTCPSGEECIKPMCQLPGCFRERLRKLGYKLVNGAVEEMTAEERAQRDKKGTDL